MPSLNDYDNELYTCCSDTSVLTEDELNQDFEVEKILAERAIPKPKRRSALKHWDANKTDYLIKWKGYPIYRASWTTDISAPEALRDWERAKERIKNGEEEEFDWHKLESLKPQLKSRRQTLRQQKRQEKQKRDHQLRKSADPSPTRKHVAQTVSISSNQSSGHKRKFDDGASYSSYDSDDSDDLPLVVPLNRTIQVLSTIASPKTLKSSKASSEAVLPSSDRDTPERSIELGTNQTLSPTIQKSSGNSEPIVVESAEIDNDVQLSPRSLEANLNHTITVRTKELSKLPTGTPTAQDTSHIETVSSRIPFQESSPSRSSSAANTPPRIQGESVAKSDQQILDTQATAQPPPKENPTTKQVITASNPFVPKKRKSRDMKLTLSHQSNIMKQKRNEPPVPPERSVLIKPTMDGVQIVHTPSSPLELRPTINAVENQLQQSTAVQHEATQESRFRASIPLVCPFFARGRCGKGPSCFFLHSKATGHPEASSLIYDQAEAESKQCGKFEKKFGFYKNAKRCNHDFPPDRCFHGDECWFAHWWPKKRITCHYYATTGGCRLSADNCPYLHFICDDIPVAPSPGPRISSSSNIVLPPTGPRARLNGLNEPGKEYESSNNTHIGELAEGENVNEIPASRNRKIGGVITSTSNQPIAGQTISVELIVIGQMTMAATLKLQEHIASPFRESTLILESFLLTKILESFISMESLLGCGNVEIDPVSRSAAVLFANGLNNVRAAAICRTPTLDIIFVPAGKNPLNSLPLIITGSTKKDLCPLHFYIFRRGVLRKNTEHSIASRLNLPAVAQDSAFGYVNRLLPGGSTWPDDFFAWKGAQAATLPKEVYLLPWGGWGKEKQLVTNYFRAFGANVHDNYHDFKTQSRKGVLILHQSFPLGMIRSLPKFNHFTLWSYNIFRMGTDSRTQKFQLERLFSTGCAILITPTLYERSPEAATKVIKRLFNRYNDRNFSKVFERSRKLARRERDGVDLDERFIRGLQEAAAGAGREPSRQHYTELLHEYKKLKRLSSENYSPDITPSIGPADADKAVPVFADWFAAQASAPIVMKGDEIMHFTSCRRGHVIYHPSEKEHWVPIWSKQFQHLSFNTCEEFIKNYP